MFFHSSCTTIAWGASVLPLPVSGERLSLLVCVTRCVYLRVIVCLCVCAYRHGTCAHVCVCMCVCSSLSVFLDASIPVYVCVCISVTSAVRQLLKVTGTHSPALPS